MPFSTFWLDPKNKVLVQNYNVLWPKRYYDPVSLNILSKVYRYSLNYFYASLISVSDVDFFANVGKVILPKISSSVKNTKDVQTFIDEFIEGTKKYRGEEKFGIIYSLAVKYDDSGA